MIGFTIHSMGKGDETPLQFTDKDAIAEGRITDAVIMESGATSVTLKIIVELPEPAGRVIVLTQTSAALLEGLQAAIRGSEYRWKEESNG